MYNIKIPCEDKTTSDSTTKNVPRTSDRLHMVDMGENEYPGPDPT